MRIFTLLLLLLCLLGAGAGLALAGEIATVAGTGEKNSGPNSGPALRTSVGEPFGVEMGPDGGLYICEVSNHRLRRLDLASGQLTTVAGTGEKGYSGNGAPATQAKLNEPYEVRFDRSGNFYFVEMQNHLVRRVDAKTHVISTVAGNGTPGFAGDGGPATRAQLQIPHSIALDDAEQLYIADLGNHRIRRVNLATGNIETWAGNGEKTLPRPNQKIAGSPVLGPRALFFTPGALWVALREGNSVWKIDLKTETWQPVAGTGKNGYAGDGGPARQALFSGPKGIAVDAGQNVFVVDTENQAIRRIDGKTGLISTLAGRGPKAAGFGGDGGPSEQALLARPHGIGLGPGGALFIGDTNNHRVRRIGKQGE